MDWLTIATGALTGLLVGLTGVGGGAVLTPLLVLLLGVAPVTAVGTDLWCAAFTKLAAARVNRGHGLIDWQVVGYLWSGSLPASAATLLWMRLHASDAHASRYLILAVGAAVVVSACAMLLQARLHALDRRLRTVDTARFKALQPMLTIACGAVLGVLVTLTSVGAGALGAVMLTYLYPFRLTPPRLIASDIVHAIPLAVFAGLGHLLIGNVNFALLGTLLVGSVPGVLAGAALSTRLPHGVLRVILACLLFVIGARLGWAAFL